MPVKAELIKTEVDLLMNLLMNVKEISMEEAALKLGVPKSTVESWANFLEEEGIISLKYKFTTPYLVFSEKPKEKEKPQIPTRLFEEPPEEDTTQKEINEIDSILSELYAQTKAGEFRLANESYPVVVDQFKKLRESMLALLKGAPHIDDLVKMEISEVESLLENARKYVEDKKFDLANSLYSQIYMKLKALLAYVKKSYESAPKKQIEAAQPKREFQISDIKLLLDTAYKFMKENRFEEAKALYERLSKLYHGLPAEYTLKKASIEQDLVKLNKDLSIKLDRFAKKQISDGSNKVSSLILMANSYIKKGDYESAATAYYKIKKMYENLPSGFQKEKNELESGIIRLYEAISAGREKIFTEEINEKSREIIVILNEIRNKIKNNNISEAGKLYDNVKRIFEGMPPGFMDEKLDLQSKIILVYDLLSQKYRESFYNVLLEKSARIMELIEDMRQKLKNNDTAAAERIYGEIKQNYMELPEGFLKEKTELQNRILKVYGELSEKSESISSRDFANKLSEIYKLLEDVENLVKKKEYDLAEELYSEITKVFGLLPQGFIEKKIELRNRILNLYREIMLNMDSPFLKLYGEDLDEKYKEILKHIIRARKAIEQEEFDLLEVIYGQVHRMFKELPVGFVQNKTKLRENALRLYREVQLYRLIPEMDTLAEKGDFQNLRNLLSFADTEKQRLITENSEDIQLFSFIERKFSNYRSLLGMKEQPQAYGAAKQTSIEKAYQPQQVKLDLTSKRKELFGVFDLKERLMPNPIKPKNSQEEPRITISTESAELNVPRINIASTEKDYGELKEKVEKLKSMAAPKLKEAGALN